MFIMHLFVKHDQILLLKLLWGRVLCNTPVEVLLIKVQVKVTLNHRTWVHPRCSPKLSLQIWHQGGIVRHPNTGCWGFRFREHRQNGQKPSKNDPKWQVGVGCVTPRVFLVGLAPGGYQYTPYQILGQSESGNIGKMAKNQFLTLGFGPISACWHFGVLRGLSEASYRVGLLARYTNTPPIT